MTRLRETLLLMLLAAVLARWMTVPVLPPRVMNPRDGTRAYPWGKEVDDWTAESAYSGSLGRAVRIC